MGKEGITVIEPRAGDSLPEYVATFLQRFSTGNAAAAAACFAADGVWASPDDEGNETGPRDVVEGVAIPAALAGDPCLGLLHTVRVCVHEDGHCLIEGDIVKSDESIGRSYGTSFQLDADGKIARAIVFRIEAVEDNAGTDRENPSGVDIQHQIDEYFRELNSAHFEAAASYFTADRGLYLHPPYEIGTARVTFRGTAELIAGFERRGAQDWLQLTDVSIQRGAYLMLEGHVLVDGTTAGPTGSFVSSATVDETGKILRYLAFYTAPMVSRR